MIERMGDSVCQDVFARRFSSLVVELKRKVSIGGLEGPSFGQSPFELVLQEVVIPRLQLGISLRPKTPGLARPFLLTDTPEGVASCI